MEQLTGIKRLLPHFTLLISLFIYHPLWAAERSLLLYSPNNAPALEAQYGYLLIKLNVTGIAPSLQFIALDKKEADLPLSEKQIKQLERTKSKFSVDLKDKDHAFYLAALPSGTYQITNVNAPYFNLPYKKSTGDSLAWRFEIQQGAINYLGELTIAKERITDFVDIRLNNRFATDLKTIKQKVISHFNAPLVNANVYRDDFSISYSEGTQ